MLAVELDELAADGKPGQLLEQEPALAPAAQAELADQLLVSGLLAGGGSDAGHQFAIGHTPRLRLNTDAVRLKSDMSFGADGAGILDHAVEWWQTNASWRSTEDSTRPKFPSRQGMPQGPECGRAQF